MSEQELDGSDVRAVFQEMCSEAVPKCVRCDLVRQTGTTGSLTECALHGTGRNRLSGSLAREQQFAREP